MIKKQDNCYKFISQEQHLEITLPMQLFKFQMTVSVALCEVKNTVATLPLHCFIFH